jgi:hypothetical protein
MKATKTKKLKKSDIVAFLRRRIDKLEARIALLEQLNAKLQLPRCNRFVRLPRLHRRRKVA